MLILKMHLEISFAWTNKICGCKACMIRCTPSLLKALYGQITITNVTSKIKNKKNTYCQI